MVKIRKNWQKFKSMLKNDTRPCIYNQMGTWRKFAIYIHENFDEILKFVKFLVLYTILIDIILKFKRTNWEEKDPRAI